MAKDKKYKSGDIVLTMTKTVKGKKVETKVSAGSFSLHDFSDSTVKGEDYYVDKAIKLGAKK